MPKPKQTPITPLRLQPRYRQMMTELAEYYQCSAPDAVRRALESLHLATFGPPKKNRKNPK